MFTSVQEELVNASHSSEESLARAMTLLGACKAFEAALRHPNQINIIDWKPYGIWPQTVRFQIRWSTVYTEGQMKVCIRLGSSMRK